MSKKREPAEVVTGVAIALAEDGIELDLEARTADGRTLRSRAFFEPDRASELGQLLVEAVATWKRAHPPPPTKQ